MPPASTLWVSHAAGVTPTRQSERERALLSAAADGALRLDVSSLEPVDVLALGAFHRRPPTPARAALWFRHTGGRALAAGRDFMIVTLALPHRAALVADDPDALAPAQVLNRCVRGVLQALRNLGLDVVYPGLDLVTHQRRAVAAISFVEIGFPTLFQAIVAVRSSFAAIPLLLDRADPGGVVPAHFFGPEDASHLSAVLGTRGASHLEPENFAEHAARGYAQSFDLEPRDRALGDPAPTPRPHGVSGPPSAEVFSNPVARVHGRLGPVEACSRIVDGCVDGFTITGDFIAPHDTPARLASRLRGRPARPADVEEAVQAFFDEDRGYLLGLRNAEVVDLVQRSVGVAT